MVLQVADPGLGQHPAVAHQHHPLEPETLSQLGHLVGDAGRIAGVARIDLDRHRTAAGRGQDPIDHLGLARLARAVVAAAQQPAGPPLVIAAGHVVEDRRAVCKVAPGQPLLDPILALQEPRIEIVLVGPARAQLLGQGGGVPEPRGGELGGRVDQALDDHGQHQVALG
jgi:hypothetical protein